MASLGDRKAPSCTFFTFFDFTACKAAQKGYIATNFCQDDVKMSQTRTSAVNVKFDLCLSLKLHELSHFSIPHPATPFKVFRSIWNTPFVISLHFIIFISFLKHMSNEGVFRLAQILTGLHIMQVKIWKNRHDLMENKTKCYCIVFGSRATRRDLHNNTNGLGLERVTTPCLE